MTTPAYDPQLSDGLDAGSDGTDVPVEAQSQLNALADECAMFGMLSWNLTVTRSGGRITREVYRRGDVQGVRVDYAYVSGGPADGLVDTETHYWSNDAGSSWTLRTDTPNGVTAGVLTYSYDGSGLCTGAAWS